MYMLKIISYILCLIISCSFWSACEKKKGNQLINDQENRELTENKFEPEDGKCIVFIGQDLGAVGGLDDYTDGYCDHFKMPAGVTVYFGMNDRGLYEKANWGSGDCCADLYPRSQKFSRSMIAIGFAIVGVEEKITRGECDEGLKKVGNWIKNLSPRPIFLRIGYEFDGFEWNHYKAETYVPAFRYIKNFFDSMQIDNIAYVWQSKGYGISLSEHEKWYPGNEYVDWCGFSYFDKYDGNMIQFARSKDKPVFIAESTPSLHDGVKYIDSDIKKPEIAQKMWNEWFVGFFRIIENNPDVVKAFSYINVDWYAQDMWKTNVVFQQCDSRIQKSEYITIRWLQKMEENRYIHDSGLVWKQ